MASKKPKSQKKTNGETEDLRQKLQAMKDQRTGLMAEQEELDGQIGCLDQEIEELESELGDDTDDEEDQEG